MQYLKVAAAQFHLIDGDLPYNMRQAESMIARVKQEKNVDLMVFCEACLDNFGSNQRLLHEYAEADMQAVASFWARMAKEAGFAILAGFLGKNQKGQWQNYAACFTPEGTILGKYAKSHLYMQERDLFIPGDDPVVFTYKGWRIAPLLCADLGFPEFSRIQAYQGVDLFLAPSCWAYPHDTLWRLCNRLRAAENTAYLVSCNRYGPQAGGRLNLGHSMAVNPKGEVIADLGTGEDCYFIANLNKAEIQAERQLCHWLQWVRPGLYKEQLSNDKI